MDNKSIALIVGGFVALIIGIMLMSTIATQEQAVVKQSRYNETITWTLCRSGQAAEPSLNQTRAECNVTLTKAPDQWRKENSCTINVFALYNATGDVMVSATDYILDSYRGVVNIRNTTGMNPIVNGNTSVVTYSYCGDDYLTEGWTRTVMDLSVGFFAIALMVLAMAMFYQVMRNEGIINL